MPLSAVPGLHQAPGSTPGKADEGIPTRPGFQVRTSLRLVPDDTGSAGLAPHVVQVVALSQGRGDRHLAFLSRPGMAELTMIVRWWMSV